MSFIKKTITIDGQRIFYLQKNPEQKDIVVFLHGFPGSHVGLVGLAEAFGSDYQIIMPDLPACGQTETLKEKHILENYSKWLNMFLGHLGIDSAVILGHSFGSRLGLFFNLEHPEKCKALVFITPVVRVDGLIANIVSLGYKIAKLLPVDIRKKAFSSKFYEQIAFAISLTVFRTADKNERNKIILENNEQLKNLHESIHIELFDEFYQSDLVELSKKVTTKALVVAGDKDKIATLKSIKALVANMPAATLKIMANSGHLVPFEKPKATAKIIKTWIKKEIYV